MYGVAYIFTTTFLCVASVGSALWVIETVIIVAKLYWIYRKKQFDAKENGVETGKPVEKPKDGNGQKKKSIYELHVVHTNEPEKKVSG